MPEFLIGDSGEVMSLGALGQPAILLGHRCELRTGSFRTVVGGGKNPIFNRDAGRGQRRAVGVHRSAEYRIGGG